jgi:hypothetical protein
MNNNNSSNNQQSFSENFTEVQDNFLENISNNISETDNVFDMLMKKFNICHDRVFAPFKITKKVQRFEQNQNIFDSNENQDFRQMYYPDNESPTLDQTNVNVTLQEQEQKEEEKENIVINTIDDSYDFFYKKMTKTELHHIQNVEKDMNINFSNIEIMITKIKKRLELKWENLIKLEKKIKKDCKMYDKNFKMIKQMKETIGNEYTDLNNNLTNYIDDIIEQNNMMNDIKTYKLLILECNFLKTCVSKYHSIQVMKKNSPICKICYTNISDHVTIPCGHLVCKKCIILTKTFSAQNVGIGTQNFNFSTLEPITYSITVFNPNQNSGSSNIANIPSILAQNLNSNNTSINNNNISTQTDTTDTSTTTLSNIFNFNTDNINTNINTNANTNTNANANAANNTTTNDNDNDNDNSIQRRQQRLSQRRERYVRRNSENRERRSTILPRRILQRRNPLPRKDKCPFCRQEIENTYRIYY